MEVAFVDLMKGRVKRCIVAEVMRINDFGDLSCIPQDLFDEKQGSFV